MTRVNFALLFFGLFLTVSAASDRNVFWTAVLCGLNTKQEKNIRTHSLLVCKTWVDSISWFAMTSLYDDITLSVTNVAFHFRSLYTTLKDYNVVNKVSFVLS